VTARRVLGPIALSLGAALTLCFILSNASAAAAGAP
jgi:hypothetical protein